MASELSAKTLAEQAAGRLSVRRNILREYWRDYAKKCLWGCPPFLSLDIQYVLDVDNVAISLLAYGKPLVTHSITWDEAVAVRIEAPSGEQMWLNEPQLPEIIQAHINLLRDTDTSKGNN